MEMNKALNELYDMGNQLLTIDEAARFLDIPNYEVAYKIQMEEMKSFIYEGIYYVAVFEVRSILEGRL